jgi:hypothetical protein
MKKHRFLLVLLPVLGIMVISLSPAVPTYGGKILVKNVSGHNIYMIFQAVFDVPGVPDKETMLCVEKGEQVRIPHRFSGKNQANPVNYYTNIFLYDFDSGLLLKNLSVKAGHFIITQGSIDSNTALFELTVDDDLLGGTP